MASPRKPLYERIPEIYRIKDAELTPPGQLEAFLGTMDEVMSGVRDSIDALYHDLFIETCADWVVPYIADLLGTSHLSGDSWTLRADVARTVHHRRRKGTLGAVESLTYTLTGWAAHAVELRERLAWNQHLNHARPDEGGAPPLLFRESLSSAVRGGTVTLRDPALLSFLDGPFCPFAHVADFKPVRQGPIRYNIPNLAVFLWRLEDYQVPVSRPGSAVSVSIAGVAAGEAAAAVRCMIHPQSDPLVLFNTFRFNADEEPPDLSHPDAVPGPMPWPRLSQDTPTGNPDSYVFVDSYIGTPGDPSSGGVGLILHVPDSIFAGTQWTFRGANLCAWEDGLRPPLRENEIVVDPNTGRVLFGVANKATQANPLASQLFVSYTYGFSGPTGAHPVARDDTPLEWINATPTVVTINESSGADPLNDALNNVQNLTDPLIIEIEDSRHYSLDIGSVTGAENQAGVFSLQPARSVWIRATAGQRPVIFLEKPLRFRPADVLNPGAAAINANLEVRLEGLYVTWNRSSGHFGGDEALVERVALNRLALDGCTLDPGGALQLDGTETGTIQNARRSFHLMNDYGFGDPVEEKEFDQTPEIEINRSMIGAAFMEDGYSMKLTHSIVEAFPVDDPHFAIAAAGSAPETEWGPDVTISGASVFGRVRVERITGEGGVFVERLESHDNQYGCIRFSYFSGDQDRLPPNHGCVYGTSAKLHFGSEIFGQSDFAQLRFVSDSRIQEQGPNRDAMGAFGYLFNTHKWKNINIRYREFMPVGVNPILVPVT